MKCMIPHFEEEEPASVVLIAGGNDIPNQDISMDDCKKVANCLIEGGRTCRLKYGVQDVYISSIMPRSNSDFQGNRHRVNKLLRELCKENNFIFIENDNIILRDHGHYDGIHLNHAGSDMLRENLLDALNF